MRRLILALLPFALILACGSSGSSDDGGSGTDGGGGTDGSTTTSPDGSTTGPDGATSPDAASGPFCASLTPAPTLCADFDQGSTPPSSQTQIDTGASCAIDGTVSLSPPDSYACKVPSGVSSVTTSLLGIPIPYDATAKRFVVSFAFRPDAAAPASGTLVIARAFLSNTHAVSIELASENGPVLREQENPPGGLDVPSANLASMPAAAAWTRYELTIDVSTKTATLKAGGAQIASMSLTGTQYDRFALNLGLQSDSAFTARYDDLVMDLQK